MSIDDLPLFRLDEDIAPEGGHFEVSEEAEVPRTARLQDPSGKIILANIKNPEYIGGIMRFSYSLKNNISGN